MLQISLMVQTNYMVLQNIVPNVLMTNSLNETFDSNIYIYILLFCGSKTLIHSMFHVNCHLMHIKFDILIKFPHFNNSENNKSNLGMLKHDCQHVFYKYIANMKRTSKAMEISDDRKRRALLVPGASESAVRNITEFFSGQKQYHKHWKELKTNVLEKYTSSFDTIYLKNKDGTDLPFLCANPLKTLEIYATCAEFNDLFLKASGQELHCIFDNDEVTAGNVLSPLKRQKCT